MRRFLSLLIIVTFSACAPGAGTFGPQGTDFAASGEEGEVPSEGAEEAALPDAAHESGVSDTPPLAGPGETWWGTCGARFEEPPSFAVKPDTVACQVGIDFLPETRAAVALELPDYSGKSVTLVIVKDGSVFQETATLKLSVKPADLDTDTWGHQLPVDDAGFLNFKIASSDQAGRYQLVLIDDDDKCYIGIGDLTVTSPCFIPFGTGGLEKVEEDSDNNEEESEFLILERGSGAKVIKLLK